MNGVEAITAVVEHLQLPDLELLLSNRGLPSIGTKDELKGRLHAALKEQFCPYEWERGAVPEYHAEIEGAGCTMCTHGNSIYVFGGMSEDRTEHHRLWRWNLETDDGFVAVKYRSQPPPTLSSWHYAAVYNEELWVFPGMRNVEMQRAFRLNLTNFTWSDRWMHGEIPTRNMSRRNLFEAIVDGNRLVLVGGVSMEEVWVFDFENAHWVCKKAEGGLSSWTFCHATKRGDKIYVVGAADGSVGAADGSDDNVFLEVWELDMKDLKWKKVPCKGTIPNYRIHCSAAVVDNKWILHGGRRPGKFNVTSKTWYLDFSDWRWYPLVADGCLPEAREWHTALGLHDCMVVVGGRTNIPEFEIPLAVAPPDTLSSAVEMLWFRPTVPTQEYVPTGKSALLLGLSGLYRNSHLSDVTLVVGPHGGPCKAIPAHRQILSQHSRVWDAMWKCSMLETETCEVRIEDFSVNAIYFMLQYMYGVLHEMPSMHSQVVEMFKAADKYDCPGLMKECVQIFRQTTEVPDIASLLQVACERCSTELREVCVELASKCLPNLVVTKTFQALIQANPDLGTTFIREVLIGLGVPSADDKESLDSEVEVTPIWGPAERSGTSLPSGGCAVSTCSTEPPAVTSPIAVRSFDGAGPAVVNAPHEGGAGLSGLAAGPSLGSSAPWTPPRRAGPEYSASTASPTTPLHR